MGGWFKRQNKSNPTPLTKEEALDFRRRTEYEDQLVISRTRLVLEINGLAGVIVALPLFSEARLAIAGVIVLLDVLWIVCAIDSAYFIGELIGRLKASLEETPPVVPPSEAFRFQVQKGRLRIGTSRFVGIYMPVLLLIAWLVGLGFALAR